MNKISPPRLRGGPRIEQKLENQRMELSWSTNKMTTVQITIENLAALDDIDRAARVI